MCVEISAVVGVLGVPTIEDDPLPRWLFALAATRFAALGPSVQNFGMGIGSEEELVGIAYASDRVEAAMIQGLLESAGIPSAVQQLGVDGPLLGIGLLNPGGGSRRVMVRADQAKAAQAVLTETLAEGEHDDWDGFSDTDHPGEARRRKPRNYNLIGAYARAWFWSLAAMGLAFAVFLLLRLV